MVFIFAMRAVNFPTMPSTKTIVLFNGLCRWNRMKFEIAHFVIYYCGQKQIIIAVNAKMVVFMLTSDITGVFGVDQ